MEKPKLIQHFEKEEMARSTIYANIKLLENGNSFKEGRSTGRPSEFTARTRTNLKKAVNNKSSVSQRRLGSIFKYNIIVIRNICFGQI